MIAEKTSRSGFTFVELMFVVVILGILAAVAAPRITGGGADTALRTTAINLSKLCAFARQSAISSQDRVTLTIKPEERQWYIELPRDDDDRKYRPKRRGERVVATDEEETHELHPRLRIAEVLIDGDEVRDEEVKVVFFPNGSSSGATIILATPKDRKMTVHIEKATGLASASRGEPRSFAEMLEEAGLDPGKYAGVESSVQHEDGRSFTPGEGFRRTAGSERERVAAYQDVAARIMGNAARKYEEERESGQVASPPTDSQQRR